MPVVAWLCWKVDRPPNPAMLPILKATEALLETQEASMVLSLAVLELPLMARQRCVQLS